MTDLPPSERAAGEFPRDLPGPPGAASSRRPAACSLVRGVPARWRIVGWIVLTSAIGLGAVVATVRSALLAEVDRAANAAIVQEAAEFREFADGRDPDTARAFTGTGALLEDFLRRQQTSPGEVLLGYSRTTDELSLVRVGQGAAGKGEVSEDYRLADDGPRLRAMLDARADTGIEATPAGTARWGRVEIATDDPGDDGGALLVAVFTGPAEQVVDRTVRVVVAVCGAALLLTSAIAWFVSGRILRPVSTVRDAATEITEKDLQRRIPVQGNDEIAALAVTFNAMLDRLEAAFATQRAFIDDAGHELRTPITIIRGHLELLGDDPQEQRETIRLVTGELDRMSRIVTDLLTLAKAEQPDFVARRPVDVMGLTLELDAKMAGLADRRWTVTSVADVVADLDEQRITQAVLQLAQNAVQHTEVGAEIQLASQLVEVSAISHVEVSVRDFGPGIAAAELGAVFERFTHGRRTAAGRQGAGLGLSIVRAIAEAHDGTVFVTSSPGRGAHFGIRVPCRAGAPAPVPTGSAPPPPVPVTALRSAIGSGQEVSR